MANEAVEEVSLKRNGLLRFLAIPYAVRKIRLRANACASCQILDGVFTAPSKIWQLAHAFAKFWTAL